MKLRIGCVVVGFLSLVLSLAAQTASSNSASTQVPPLIQFSNVATDAGGNTLSGVISITFSLYAAQQGGEPLWTETQNNVQLDATGHYSVQLGITKANGVPTTLFTSGEARWLGVQIGEQAQPPRVLLLSVPYALKAGDAATIGGLPPSAFVLASPQSPAYVAESAATQSVPPPTSSDVTTSGGTVNYLPLWDTTSDITSSVVFQSGKKIGIGTTTPASTLDINGGNTVRGTLTLPATAKATASAGADSQPLKFQASSFNSTSSTAVNQSFQWQAEPAANDTASPSGTLNLLYGPGATAPSETGLQIASNGLITFATGQTFPGAAGSGTVTSVATGLGLKGGPITTSGTLKIDTTVVPQLAAANKFTTNQTINGTGGVGSYGLTVNQPTQTGILIEGPITGSGAGLDLATTGTGGKQWEILATGNTASQGVGKLNIRDVTSSTDVFTIDASDTVNVNTNLNVAGGSITLTGNETVNGNLSATGVVTGSGYQIGSQLFDYTNAGAGNAFLGFGGNTTMTGNGNTAAGSQALAQNTTGFDNTATGGQALYNNCSAGCTFANESGTGNSAFGYESLYANTTGGDNSAFGSLAMDSNTTGSNNTATGSFAGGTNDVSNLTGSNNTALGFNASFSTGTLNNATAIGANALVSASNALVLGSFAGSQLCGGLCPNTNVGIGTSTPGATLEVDGPNQLDVLIQAPESGTGAGLDLNTTGTGGLHWEILDTGSTAAQGANKLNIRNVNAGTDVLTILASGKVGIGTTTPGTALTVNGIVDALGGFAGQCLANENFDVATINFCNMDLAEAYTSAEATEAGDLVALVPTSEATVRKSSKRYEPLLLGVVSTNPGLVFDNGKTHLAGDNTVAASKDKAVIALAGRVPVKVSIENGAIGVGDPLTSSSHSGVAMKATAAGKIIGYALAPATKNGKVLMFVQPGYYAAPQLASLQSKMVQLHHENLQLQSLVRAQSAAMRSLEAQVREDRETLRKVKAQVTAIQTPLMAAK